MAYIKRKKTKRITVGDVAVGDFAPIAVQSMTNTNMQDVESTLNQIKSLYIKGCEIVRCAIMDKNAALSLKKIKQHSPLPIIADIHFDYKLALHALEAGADGIRINPGNIGSFGKIKEIIRLSKDKNSAIRIGVNSGSLEKQLLNKYNSPSVDALVESAYNWVKRFEDENFYDMKVSIKSSDPLTTIMSNEKLSDLINYPLHLGVTEAGNSYEGIIKSVSALSVLLKEGIGDTIRISLTQPPENEIDVCYEMLNALHLRKKRSIDIVSCPTCGRIEIDLISIVDEIKKRLNDIKKPIKVSVMGCVVNALGEAKEADLAIAGGNRFGLIIKHGKILKKVSEDKLVDEFVKIVKEYIGELDEKGNN